MEEFQYVNLEYLELMTEGDEEMQKEMLGMLLIEFENEIPKMKLANMAEDWEDLGNLSHKFKSTLNFVGNELMTEANAHVEKISKSGLNTGKVTELLEILENLSSKVVIELRDAYETI